MKLYMHPASPNVRAVLMTAELLELPLEKQLVDAMAGEQACSLRAAAPPYDSPMSPRSLTLLR